MMETNKLKRGLSLLMIFGLFFISNAQYLTEGFESSSIPTGWIEEQVLEDLHWSYQEGGNTIGGNTIPAYSHSGDRNALLLGNGSTWGETKLITPELDLSTATNPKITFWHAQKEYLNTVEKLRLYYKTSATAEWVLIQEWDSDTENWQEESIQLPNPSSTYYVAFEGRVLYAYGIGIDDVAIADNFACIEPSGLSVTNLTDSQADLSWNENGSATVWDIELVAAGTIPTGNATYENVTNSYTAIELSPATSYDFYVRADCNEDNSNTSDWVGPYTFLTECSTIDAPYTEDFENTGNIPACWGQSGANISNWDFTDNISVGHVGDNDDTYGTSTESGGYFAWIDDSQLNFDSNIGLETPSINLSTVSSPILTFYMISNNEGDNHESAGINVLVWNGSTWTVELTEENNTNGWVLKTIDLSSYSGVIKIKFEVYQIGPESVNNSYFDDLAIDDIMVKSANNVGINTVVNNQEFTIQPNPAHNYILIKNAQLNTENIQIFDIAGKLVKQVKQQNEEQTFINIDDLEKGIYFVKIGTKSNRLIIE